MTRMFVRTVGVALALSFSTASFAGGGGGHHGGMMFHPPVMMHSAGHGWGHGYAGQSGGGRMRVEAGNWGYRGRGTMSYGHTDTAFHTGYARRFVGGGFDERGRAGFRSGYGHVDTGLRYARPEVRYGARRYPGYGYRYAGSPGVYGGGAYGADYGTYGSDTNQYAAPSGSVYVVGGQSRGEEGSTETGYAGGPVQQGYAEPPLSAVGYGGGPQILVVHGEEQRRATCTCRSDAPVVYRYGVGSYY